MKVHEVKRLLATAPDSADVFVSEDEIRIVPETDRAPPLTPSPSSTDHDAPTLSPPVALPDIPRPPIVPTIDADAAPLMGSPPGLGFYRGRAEPLRRHFK